ncbi:M20/M25/M40 family metallo-hydrolase [Bacillus sp. JCM 19041]|uniref:M20/M25/M40 family metallo-hydrolase n=1 Tax=Bacillus sp. JCM 19041 TaxID=1460637 RepID=UPI0006D1BE86
MKKSVAVLALTALIFTGGTVSNPNVELVSGKSQVGEASISTIDMDRLFLKHFDAENVYSHIYHLSENIGPRVTGSAEEKAAAAYLKREFRKNLYRVTEQEFSIPDRLRGTLTLDGEDVPITAATGSAPTNNEGLTAGLFDAGFGAPEDFTDEVEGKIAVISRGNTTFAEKATNAVAAGAVGVIIYNNIDSLVPLNPNLAGTEIKVPVVGVKKEDGARLLEQSEVTLQLEALTNQTSTNIIATRKPLISKPNPGIVYITAHYDSVPGAPGANDNASGTATMLEMARVLKFLPIDKEVRFIAFGAEEIGLVGAREYVKQLSDREIERSVANFNMDMVGTKWERASKLFVNVTDGEPNIVWETSQNAAKKRGYEDELLLSQGGSSDHVAFHEVGIPSANFIRREPGTGALEPWYHTPLDTVENISVDRLQVAGEIVGQAVIDTIKKDFRWKKTNGGMMKVEDEDIYTDLK